MPDYSRLSDELFRDLLTELLEDISRSEILDIPGVYDLVAAYYKTEVYELYENQYLTDEDE